MGMLEVGQLVLVRNRHFLVQDISEYQPDDTSQTFHKVALECLDDDRLGENVELIWEHEPESHITVHDSIQFPELVDWDNFKRFQAFYYAIYWSSGSIIEGPEITAPFRSGIELDYYQLEPVTRALMMPRANLLIADDVGLGKTIEAGLVAQELLSRQTIRKIMIICPASLQQQWKEEMESKFQLKFEIINREAILRLRREYGVHVNPWKSFPRIITSMDFLKREQPLREFLNSLKHKEKTSVLKDWDLLIVDEAHNVAPSGRKNYIRDSDRTRMMRQIVDHFEHRLFLTATPHNGYTESFTALLEFLDPLRFSRGPILNKEHLKTVMVRRLKDEIVDSLGDRKFTQRRVVPLEIEMGDKEKSMYSALDQYIDSRLKSRTGKDLLPIRFTLVLLKKRLLSSPLAFFRSIKTHIGDKGMVDQESEDLNLIEKMVQRTLMEDWDNDEEKTQYEEDAIQEASKFFKGLTEEEKGLIRLMRDTSESLKSRPDGKASTLISWIESNLCPGGKWNDERLLIFTEYKDTLEYLEGLFIKKGWEKRFIKLYGGMAAANREEVKRIFQAHPSENPTRILLATDAASEGLNLQNHCRYLVHYEIPWNPNRMEQRNGRIDRHGQKAPEVFIHHFLYKNNEDSEFLRHVVKKVQRMREDLGSIGEIISDQVEGVMLRERKHGILDLSEREEHLKRVKDDIKIDLDIKTQTHNLSQQLATAQQDWNLYPENLKLVLDEALKIADPGNGLEEIKDRELAGKGYRLKGPLPRGWEDCKASITSEKDRRLALVFDHHLARDRKDVALVHLNHPLMKRAIGVFRKNLWSFGYTEDQQLKRASYNVLPSNRLPRPVLVAYARVIAMNKLGRKLHESIVKIGLEIHHHNLVEVNPEVLHGLLDEEGSFPEIPKELGDKLRGLFPFHKDKITEIFKGLEAKETEKINEKLRDKAQKESAAIKALMEERIKEIKKRLEGAEEEKQRLFRQASLVEFGVAGPEMEEIQQFDEDIDWLQKKLEDLKGRLESEPKKVEEKYALKSVRVFPMGLLYLIPDSMLEKGGK
jgi:SNF2 family DNA or RNA helicase